MTVRILGMPVELHARAAEHGEELQREFTLIAQGLEHADHRAEMPRRLLALIATLQGGYSGFTTEQEDLLDQPSAPGGSTLDLTFRVPGAPRTPLSPSERCWTRRTSTVARASIS